MKKLSDKESFEKHWKTAFRDAAKKPPDAVWDKINAELTGMEVSGYKKRLMIFKWLAAASVLLAVGLGFYTFYLHNGLQEGSLSDKQPVKNAPALSDGRPEASEIAVADINENKKIPEKTIRGRSETEQDYKDFNRKEAGKENKTANIDNKTGVQANLRQITGRPSNNIVALAVPGGNEVRGSDVAPLNATLEESQRVFTPGSLKPLALNLQMEKPALPVAYMYKRPVFPVRFKEKKAEQPVQFYAGLNFSTGRFNANYANGGEKIPAMNAELAVYSEANARVMNNMAIPDNTDISSESYQPAFSYTYGLNMGAKVARRWVIRSGVSYIKANTIANASAYIQDHSNNEKYPILKAANYQRDGVVEIHQAENIQYENVFEFASVPLKAGYILLDKKLDLILFGGVSSDFFIKNTITQEDNLTNVVENSPGSSSPYKNVYFNGSLSTALGYTIAEHYRISFEPGYRMALNAFTKDSFILTGKPDAFYVNFGVSYRFK